MEKVFLSIAIVALAFTACNKEDNSQTESDKVAVQFANGTISRASGVEWDVDDKVGIYMFTANTSIVYGRNSNVEYVNTAGEGESADFSVVDFTNIIYYPLDSTKVDFVAYYPYSSDKIGAEDHIYEVDVNDQSDKSAIDLLVSNNLRNKAASTSSLAFKFSHVLSQLNVVVKTGVGSVSLDGLEVAVKGLKLSGGYDITSAAIDFGTAQPTDLIIPNNEAIIIPQTSVISFVVKTSDNEVGFETAAASVIFESGKSTTVTLTLNRTGVSFEGDATISDWVNSGNDSSLGAQ